MDRYICIKADNYCKKGNFYMAWDEEVGPYYDASNPFKIVNYDPDRSNSHIAYTQIQFESIFKELSWHRNQQINKILK